MAKVKVKKVACKDCDYATDECHCWICLSCNKVNTLGEKDPCERCYKCEACCKCWRCTGCGNRYTAEDKPCQYCNKCRHGCCRCRVCQGCNTRVTGNDVCDNCGKCDSCCRCTGHKIKFRRVDTITFHKAKMVGLAKAEHKINPSERFCSLEVEVSAAKAGREPSKKFMDFCEEWNLAIVHDGSLPGGGFEINTAPASGDKFVEEMTKLGELLKLCQAEANASCGLHCHVDCKSFSYEEMRKLMRVYCALEDGLFRIIAPSRKVSQYCAPAKNWLLPIATGKYTKEGRADAVKKGIFTKLYGTDKPDKTRLETKGGGYRYAAFNLQSWMMRGTVEFRLHHGTVEAEKMINWGILMSALVDYAYTATEAQLEALAAMDPLAAMLEVAPTEANKAYVKERWEKFAPKTPPTEKK